MPDRPFVRHTVTPAARRRTRRNTGANWLARIVCAEVRLRRTAFQKSLALDAVLQMNRPVAAFTPPGRSSARDRHPLGPQRRQPRSAGWPPAANAPPVAEKTPADSKVLHSDPLNVPTRSGKSLNTRTLRLPRSYSHSCSRPESIGLGWLIVFLRLQALCVLRTIPSTYSTPCASHQASQCRSTAKNGLSVVPDISQISTPGRVASGWRIPLMRSKGSSTVVDPPRPGPSRPQD